MGNNSSSPEEDDNNNNNNIREQQGSGEFQKVDFPTPQTSPKSTNQNPNDLANSGILVENPMSSAEEIAKRRIVKATPPTPTNTTTTAAGTGTGTSMESGDDDDDDEKIKETPSEKTVVSSKNDETLLQESIELDRTKRMQQLQKDQKSKRQQAIDERRKNQSSSSSTTKTTTTSSSSSAASSSNSSSEKPTPQANPFSRFLSAFSVETKNPHHKRAHEEDTESTKRPKLDAESSPGTSSRAATAAASGSNGNDNEEEPLTSKILNHPKLPMVAAAATAVAAMAVMMAMRFKKK